jgi:hypothetical protein
MKTVHTVSSILLGSVILLSCGLGRGKNAVIKTKDGEVTVNNIQEAGEQMKAAADDAEKRRAERKAKGDTLAMNYKDLQKYLPDVAGYEKDGEPSGESTNMAGFGSFSTAEQRYKSGDKTIHVELMDYNQSAFGFTTASTMFSMNIQMENDKEKSGSFDTGMKYVKGFEQMYKKDNNATVTYAIADRFMLTIKSDGSNDVDMLKNVAKSMNLAELSSK